MKKMWELATLIVATGAYINTWIIRRTMERTLEELPRVRGPPCPFPRG